MARKPEDASASRADPFAEPLSPLSLAFRCDVAYFEERVIIGVRGEVDLATAPDLHRELRAVLNVPLRGVVVDLGYCTFMDSSGVAALVETMREARASNIEFKLTSVPRNIRLVLELAGLAEQFGLAGGTSWELATHPRRLAT